VGLWEPSVFMLLVGQRNVRQERTTLIRVRVLRGHIARPHSIALNVLPVGERATILDRATLGEQRRSTEASTEELAEQVATRIGRGGRAASVRARAIEQTGIPGELLIRVALLVQILLIVELLLLRARPELSPSLRQVGVHLGLAQVGVVVAD